MRYDEIDDYLTKKTTETEEIEVMGKKEVKFEVTQEEEKNGQTNQRSQQAEIVGESKENEEKKGDIEGSQGESKEPEIELKNPLLENIFLN